MLTSVAASSVRSDPNPSPNPYGLALSHTWMRMGGKCSWSILGQTVFFPLTRQEGASVVLHSLRVQRRLCPEFQLLCP